mmetsp:Transcript_7171/g.8080  ORF Transcript_7171/g.8080 Transcript_7171/m.8080 type:complete len:277 (+) Transcript_7171:407-1237(+)
MRIGENQLRVRYPKQINSLYTQDFEKKRGCVGGKTQMFNRDKEKKFFKADQITMKTTKQMDFQGEQVPYEKVQNKRPATSYGPFISSTSYGNTFQGWDVTGSYAPALVPKGNLQSSTNMPFRATSAYRETYKSVPASRPGSNVSGPRGANGGKKSGRKAGAGAGAGSSRKDVRDPSKVFGGKNRAQKSQISILSSPDKKTPFTKETTNRVEFQGQRNLERSRPIRHPDNLGNFNLQVGSKAFGTSYRNNFNNFGNDGHCKREDERIGIRKELKQLQ